MLMGPIIFSHCKVETYKSSRFWILYLLFLVLIFLLLMSCSPRYVSRPGLHVSFGVPSLLLPCFHVSLPGILNFNKPKGHQDVKLLFKRISLFLPRHFSYFEAALFLKNILSLEHTDPT